MTSSSALLSIYLPLSLSSISTAVVARSMTPSLVLISPTLGLLCAPLLFATQHSLRHAVERRLQTCQPHMRHRSRHDIHRTKTIQQGVLSTAQHEARSEKAPRTKNTYDSRTKEDARTKQGSEQTTAAAAATHPKSPIKTHLRGGLPHGPPEIRASTVQDRGASVHGRVVPS